jgi:hypothetical protein
MAMGKANYFYKKLKISVYKRLKPMVARLLIFSGLLVLFTPYICKM